MFPSRSRGSAAPSAPGTEEEGQNPEGPGDPGVPGRAEGQTDRGRENSLGPRAARPFMAVVLRAKPANPAVAERSMVEPGPPCGCPDKTGRVF